uniref:major facilitator superfamily domain-containing protein 10 n=1 Tax=Myxine glutinosa TaxID=7769 RepID=UPI00358E0A23
MAEQQQQQQQEENRAKHVITAIFVVILLDLLGFTLILPLLPSLIESYGNEDESGLYQKMQAGVNWFADGVGVPSSKRYNAVLFGGLLGSLFSLLQFLSNPIMGAASDRYGRRPIMGLCLVGVMASYIIWAAAGDFSMFLVSRVLGGFSRCSVSLAAASIADLTRSAHARGMAMVGAAFSVGFIVGPILGAVIGAGAGGGSYAAWLALAFSGAAVVVLSLAVPETLLPEDRAPSVLVGCKEALYLISPAELFNFTTLERRKETLTQADLHHLRQLGRLYFLYIFIYSGLEFTLAFLTHTRFHYSSMQQGKMLFLVGVAMAAVQGGYVRRVRRHQELKLVKRALLLLIPAFLLVGWATSEPMLYLGLLLYAFASATVVPCLTTIVASLGSPNQKGIMMGTLRSLGALARALGPAFAATGFWMLGAELCYTVGAALLVIPLALLGSIGAETVKAK